jgi:trimethylamine---corrinoid protein Co-methyltransferase
MFRNDMPYYEVLDEAALGTIERGWQRIVREIGIEFMHDEAIELFRAAGQRIEGEVVFLDPDFMLEQLAQAPSVFDVRARNPEHTITLGGRHMVFAPVSGPPFFRVGDQRRDGTMADYELMAKLVQHFDDLDIATMPMIEPNDRPLDSRHLDMMYACMTWRGCCTRARTSTRRSARTATRSPRR